MMQPWSGCSAIGVRAVDTSIPVDDGLSTRQSAGMLMPLGLESCEVASCSDRASVFSSTTTASSRSCTGHMANLTEVFTC